MKIQLTITLEPGETMPEINLSPPSSPGHREVQLDAYVEHGAPPLSGPIGFRP